MKQTITFIGNGNMGLSIAQGLKHDYTIEVVGRNQEKMDAFVTALGVEVKTAFMQDYDITNKTLIFCVKPANTVEVGAKLKGEASLVLSVLAGTTLETLKQNIASKATVRTMPNLAASVARSMTTMTGDSSAKEQALTLMRSIGDTLWLDSEKELNISTALAGSGPAYLALMAEALADGAVKQGLKREYAMQVMRGLFGGFGELIQDIHPAILKDNVMSPGGTTAAGYAALEEEGVRNACIKAIDKAYAKAVDLS